MNSEPTTDASQKESKLISENSCNKPAPNQKSGDTIIDVKSVIPKHR